MRVEGIPGIAKYQENVVKAVGSISPDRDSSSNNQSQSFAEIYRKELALYQPHKVQRKNNPPISVAEEILYNLYHRIDLKS